MRFVKMVVFGVLFTAGRAFAESGPEPGGWFDLGRPADMQSPAQSTMSPNESAWSLVQEAPRPNDVEPQEGEPIASQVQTNSWQFHLAPYVWMAGVEGDTGIGQFEISADADFIDLLKKLDLGAMLHFEGHRENFGFMLDGLYMRVGDETRVRVGDIRIRGIDVDGTLELIQIEAAVFYRLGEPRASFDILAGARYFSIDVEVDAGPLPSLSRNKGWVDPIVGGRLHLGLAERWSLSLRGDIGGFGVGSDFTWNATALVGYHISDSVTLAVGYRHLDVDYDDGGFTFDTQFSGPYIGLNFAL